MRASRALDQGFLRSIPWHEVRKHPLNPAFVPVLIYMRDVESFTDIYYQELLRTPTGTTSSPPSLRAATA
jgi:hypothetical protein